MADRAIRVENLVVEYRTRLGKRVRAVDGLSFQVFRGEVIGFLGPNGAGKSSTLRTIMGFQRPASGQAFIFGEPAGSVKAKQRIGFLPEVAVYYPFLTPREILRMYGKLQGLHGNQLKREVDWLLLRVGLETKGNTLCRNLSKGLLQRVGIAQALLGSPDLLILDEVTSGLDPVGRRDLRRLLQEKQRAGTTIFFSSHELTAVEMLCDRVIVINEGRMVEERAVNELRESMRHFYVRFFPPIELDDLEADWNVENGEVFAYFKNKETQLEALRRMHDEGCKVIDFSISEGSLEDYFVETINRRAA